jgi:hypothetical protein
MTTSDPKRPVRPNEPQPLAREHLRGRLFITIEEAASLYGVSPRTARRWATDYIDSNGARGIPVVQVTRRRRLVVVSKLLDPLGDSSEGGR